MPLNNIALPASCYKLFEDLISIASFDFFEPTEHFDFNITETKPFSPKFEQLGYPSRNILENMGSIAILIGMKLAYTILFILASIFDSCNICCSYSHSCCHMIRNTWNNQTNPRHFVNSWIGFILGIFIELLICSAISVSFIS